MWRCGYQRSCSGNGTRLCLTCRRKFALSAQSALRDQLFATALFSNLAFGVLVEKMAPKGVELVVGVKRDPDWGPVLLIGLGGIFIEILKDVRLLPVNLTEDAIVEEIGQLRGAMILQGARGAPPADIRAVARIAWALGRERKVATAIYFNSRSQSLLGGSNEIQLEILARDLLR